MKPFLQSPHSLLMKTMGVFLLVLGLQGLGMAMEGKVDVNTATVKELQMLPGVGKAIAERIVEYRKTNGPFESVDDLKNVKGIGKAKLDKLKDHVNIE